MWSKSVNKTLLILGLLLLVLAVGILARTDVGKGYLSWLKATVLNMNPLASKQNTNTGDSGLNFSNLNIDQNQNQQNQEKKQEPVASQESAPAQMTVEQIQAKMNEIAVKIDALGKQVEREKAINAIQAQINDIARKANDLAKQVEEMNRLASIQQQLDSIAQKANLLSQEISQLT